MRIGILTLITFTIFTACDNTNNSNLIEKGDMLSSGIVDTCECSELIQDSLGTYFKNDSLFTGICISYYPNSSSKYVEKNLLKGLLHGSVFYYDKNGEVLIEEIYENGHSKRSGKAEVLNCSCNELTLMKASNPDLPARYSLDDIPYTGKCESFYPESEYIYMEANYWEGFLNGYTTFYNKDGSKLYMEVYKNGVLEKTIY